MEDHFLDSTSIRAHQHAAGAKGGKTNRLWAEVGVVLVLRCTLRRRAEANP